MAVPFRRVSKTKKRMRRTHFKLSVSGLVTCPNCGEMIVSHRICPKCGFYDGKQVVSKGKQESKVEEKKDDKKALKAKKAKKAETSKTEEKEVK